MVPYFRKTYHHSEWKETNNFFRSRLYYVMNHTYDVCEFQIEFFASKKLQLSVLTDLLLFSSFSALFRGQVGGRVIIGDLC